jgi:hypothetical protein
VDEQGRKQFFFERKNQKTLFPLAYAAGKSATATHEFLLLFLKQMPFLQSGLCARSKNRLKNPGGLAGCFCAARAAFAAARAASAACLSFSASHLSKDIPAFAARLASYARCPAVKLRDGGCVGISTL